MNHATSGVNWDALWVVLPVLLLAGLAFNALITYLSRQGHTEGYEWLEVVVGTLFTLAGAAFVIGPVPALIVLAAFAASGLPMALGAIYRYARKQADFRAFLRQLGKSHDQAPPPAQPRPRND